MELRISFFPGRTIFMLSITLMLFSQFSLFAQTAEGDYSKEWINVDALMAKSLDKSALEAVDQIFLKAKKDNNQPEQVKAVLYKIDISNRFEEDSDESAITLVLKEIKSAQFPASAIYHSILAELYWNYYVSHRYEWLNRTTTKTVESEDIKTWDLQKLISKVIENHLEAVKMATQLKAVPRNTYQVLIQQDIYNSDEERKDAEKVRPSLYDFLCHRAIDRFMFEETSLPHPADQFLIDDASYLSSYQIFASLPLKTKDTLSLKFHALTLLQQLIDFHMGDKDASALIDVDLKRLAFVRNLSVIDNKDELYSKVLENLQSSFKNDPASADVAYQRAQWLSSIANQYKPLESEKHKFDQLKAIAICDEINKIFPKSNGAKNCRLLSKQITQLSMALVMDDVVVPGKNLGLLSYKNLERVYWRIIPVEPARDKEIRQSGDSKSMLKAYLNMTAIQSGSLELPVDKDYNMHKVQVPIPEVPVGYYIILLSPGKDFEFEAYPLAYTSFWSSNISYISRRNSKGEYEVFILDRQSGKALKGATVEGWVSDYDYKSRTRKEKLWKSYTTDNDGYVNISNPGDKSSRSFYLLIKSGNDRLASDEYFYLSDNISNQNDQRESTYIFTDRAIYRPGQTIFYKGIVLSGKGNDLKVRPGFQTLVVLYDVNGRDIGETKVTTNEFGSFSGTFIAPSGTLNGNMRIANEYGSAEIRVEEYKRPRFEIKFLPIEGEYSLNSLVTITGTAKTYAGNPVDGAKVTFRVVRTARFPYWFDYKGIMPSSSSLEIMNGNTLTNPKGEFQIVFKALPDREIPKSSMPVFNYQVFADVVDINGEVRSTNVTVSVGYASFILNSDIDAEVNSDTYDHFSISAKNLANKNIPAEALIMISQLKQPDRIYRSRKWDRPDKFMMNEEDFHKNYPFDLFNNEDDKTHWAEIALKFNKLVKMPGDSIIEIIDIKTWPSGDYCLKIMSIDKTGDTIRYKKYFTVYSETKKKMPGNTMKWFSLSEKPYEPGTTANVFFASASKEVRVLYELLKERTVISRKWLDISNEMINIPIPIVEDYRGNIGVCFTFVRNNRYYQSSEVINVPFTNKDLDISFETFRDKLQPGQKEEWHMKITGKMKEKVASELLISMYDASLDAFTPHKWAMDLYHSNSYFQPWKCDDVFSMKSTVMSYFHNTKQTESYYYRKYDVMIMDRRMGQFYNNLREDSWSDAGERTNFKHTPMMAKGKMDALSVEGNAMLEDDLMVSAEPIAKETIKKGDLPPQSPTRTNLNETAFFFPDLKTNENGDIIVKFTLPELLTRWKVQGLAHTKELKTGLITKELVAQKDLMVFPNPPRFFREGDKITFSTKISSLSKNDLTAHVSLELFDAITMKEIGNEMITDMSHEVNLPAGGSNSTSWTFDIPFTYQAIGWRVRAQVGEFTDGEESTLPVLSNRTMVTEALSLPVRGKGKFTFDMTKLAQQGVNPSSTLKSHQLSLEFTSNPAWYAIQALPYLMEYPYECSEQTFNRYYANQLASNIASFDPAIRKVFETWSKYTPSALLSNLEKNQDLKSVILEETPWVMQAKDESERKQRIGLLFDLNRMANEASTSIQKLSELQTSNGGWPWFAGMPDDRYITQYILSGYGHMLRLGIFKDGEEAIASQMIAKALLYSDQRIKEEYDDVIKFSGKTLQDNHLNQSNIQYLYMRSFYISSIEVNEGSLEAMNYFKAQARKYWTSQNPYMQGMIALALNRMGDVKTPKEIMRSLKERSLHNTELGMYWKDMTSGYNWNQQGIATQALLIEAFDEINKDSTSVEDMKLWLLKQKQTTDWRTTTATADACFALLLRGTDVLKNTGKTVISVGNIVFDPQENPAIKAEAGTGYFRTSWWGNDIHPEMSKVTVNKEDKGVAWGALYWQYFENMDKITSVAGPVKIDRQLFLKKNIASGPVLEKVTSGNPIKSGDKVVVRITLVSDRDMEYVHLKDLRAAGLEPVDVLSGYEYQDGLGYYQSTKDAGTHFFFSYLPKGTRIFEYTLSASQKGEFSQGITSVECMYAPEFSAHSEGIRIKIE